jgi:Zn-dependent protease with chaperone function/uncharacterized tellurite resistance protein B-like protein
VNFFEQQNRARQKTRHLIILLCMAVISLIAITTLFIATLIYFQQPYTGEDPASFSSGLLGSISLETFGLISLVIIAVVFSGSLYKSFQVRAGGKVVAEALGGRLIKGDTQVFAERKVLNVVEEMAIASGTPVPPVYLIDDDSVNAFAAGNNPRDAVIGITRGAIELLNRDELQGVIAHEFSHVFHGDMKLNMRLVAILHGILLIGLIGGFLLRSSAYARSRSSKDNSRAAIMMLGLGLVIIGYTGTFFGNLIKSAVSRQREFLADASSVQFTRNPKGIGNALKKLGGHPARSQLSSAHAAEFSHLYFADGMSRMFSMFATHPKLEERIKRIEPGWNGQFIYTTTDDRETVAEQDRQTFTTETEKPAARTGLSGQETLAVIAALSQIGQPNASHLDYAHQTLLSMDESLRIAARDPIQAQAIIYGLLLHKSEKEKNHQLALLDQHLGFTDSIKETLYKATSVNERHRLPLIELCLPHLKELDRDAIDSFLSGVHKLIYADMRVSGMEWAINHTLRHHLLELPVGPERFVLSDLESEVSQLLSMLAHSGADSTEAAQIAFNAAVKELGMNMQLIEKQKLTLTHVDQALERLNQLKPLQKPKLLKALASCVMADNEISVREAELLRAMAAALDCPVPPIITTPLAS